MLKDKQARQSKRFKWTEQLQRLFALEVAKVGLKNIKPKYIQQKFFKYGLQNSNIGSHLQKFKLRIQKEYHLDSFDQFENWMGLHEYENDPEISKVLEEQRAKQNSVDSQSTSYNELTLMEFIAFDNM